MAYCENAVNAVFHDHFGVARFDVDVTGAALESSEDNGVHQANDGAHAGFAGELLHRNVFVAVLFVADDLKSETFGGLVENALGLLGALQQVANLRGRGDFNLQALAEKQRELVGQLQLAGIGNGDNQGAVAGLERNEIVAEHHFRRNAAEEFGVNALLAKIHERAAVAISELLGLVALGGLVSDACGSRIVVRGCHGINFLRYQPGRGRTWADTRLSK